MVKLFVWMYMCVCIYDGECSSSSCVKYRMWICLYVYMVNSGDGYRECPLTTGTTHTYILLARRSLCGDIVSPSPHPRSTSQTPKP